MANLYKRDGETFAEIAGVDIPFKYLTAQGVTELVRLCLNQTPLFMLDGRGSKKKTLDDNAALVQMADKLLTPEGLEWARNHRIAKAKPRVETVTLDTNEESEEDELTRLINEQKTDG